MFTQPALHVLVWSASHHCKLLGNYLTISNWLKVGWAMCQMGFYLELDQFNNIHHHIKGVFLQKEEFLLQYIWQTCHLILGIFAELCKKERIKSDSSSRPGWKHVSQPCSFILPRFCCHVSQTKVYIFKSPLLKSRFPNGSGIANYCQSLPLNKMSLSDWYANTAEPWWRSIWDGYVLVEEGKVQNMSSTLMSNLG